MLLFSWLTALTRSVAQEQVYLLSRLVRSLHYALQQRRLVQATGLSSSSRCAASHRGSRLDGGGACGALNSELFPLHGLPSFFIQAAPPFDALHCYG
ncbi:hypothetical protein RHIZ404_200707 [Rhizobium sp. EC-SD404]|nr:hypothetical protein RHIZ404_200707 [Rhizobium sp. EC-SD404]